MEKIRIVADSASDITVKHAKELDVSVIPVNVLIGDEHFKDGIDIDSRTFFERMRNENITPKTSQPSPEDYIEEFKKFSDYTDIICICLTSKGSGTYNSACLAKTLLQEENFPVNIHVVDSLNASIPILETVQVAKRMVDDGKPVSEILEKVEFLKDKMALYFVLDTLEYVRKGGRIGNVKAVLGTILKIKPLLTFIKGYAQDVDKVRGAPSARAKLIEYFKNKAYKFDEVSIVHAFNIEQAKLLEEELLAKFHNIKITMYEVGTSIGSYTGPGGVGLVFREKSSRWS